MTEARVNVNGKILDASKAAGLSRKFRSAWVDDVDVVSVDLPAAKLIAHGIRSKWRAWKEKEPFTWKNKKFSSSDDSVKRIEGELKAAELKEARGVNYILATGWKADDGSYTSPLSLTDLQDLFLAMRDYQTEVFTESETKVEEINVAMNAAALEAIVKAMEDEAGDGLD